MRIFLASDLGTSKYNVGAKRTVSKIDNSNNMLDILNSVVKNRNKIVVFSGYPDDYEKTEERNILKRESFIISDFNFKEVVMLDDRNSSNVEDIIKDADLILLSGGYLPGQNQWFNKINLREALENYNGVIVGESAGAMNMADVVYSCPEKKGEAIDPTFNRWVRGLGLTNINIFPHYDYYKNIEVDGLNMMKDIVLKDSYKGTIYALNDGAFIEIYNNETILHGECYKIENGKTVKINEDKEVKILV